MVLIFGAQWHFRASVTTQMVAGLEAVHLPTQPLIATLQGKASCLALRLLNHSRNLLHLRSVRGVSLET